MTRMNANQKRLRTDSSIRAHSRHSRVLFLSLLCAFCAFSWLNCFASDFAAQFERIKANATKAQLYTFLYAVPKGGDLHHHSGGCWQMDSLYQVATNTARPSSDIPMP